MNDSIEGDTDCGCFEEPCGCGEDHGAGVGDDGVRIKVHARDAEHDRISGEDFGFTADDYRISSEGASLRGADDGVDVDVHAHLSENDRIDRYAEYLRSRDNCVCGKYACNDRLQHSIDARRAGYFGRDDRIGAEGEHPDALDPRLGGEGASLDNLDDGVSGEVELEGGQVQPRVESQRLRNALEEYRVDGEGA